MEWSLNTMEQNNKTEKNKIEIPEIKVETENETIEVNPLVDAFEAISKVMVPEGAEQDMTEMFGALLSMPDREFETIAPILMDEINRSLNNPADRITLVAAMTSQGYSGQDLTETFDEICKEIDNQLTEMSQIKKDWLKQLMGATINAINETEGISKRFVRIPYERCHKDAKEPAYAHASDSGMDVYALEDITLAPGEQKIIPIGIKVALPAGYELQVRAKSSIAAKTKFRIANGIGTIDAGYRNEIGVIIENNEPPIRDITYEPELDENGNIIKLNITSILYGSSYTISKGQKFAQLVLSEVPKAVLYEVESVGDIGDNRGGGWGSTGKF